VVHAALALDLARRFSRDWLERITRSDQRQQRTLGPAREPDVPRRGGTHWPEFASAFRAFQISTKNVAMAPDSVTASAAWRGAPPRHRGRARGLWSNGNHVL